MLDKVSFFTSDLETEYTHQLPMFVLLHAYE